MHACMHAWLWPCTSHREGLTCAHGEHLCLPLLVVPPPLHLHAGAVAHLQDGSTRPRHGAVGWPRRGEPSPPPPVGQAEGRTCGEGAQVAHAVCVGQEQHLATSGHRPTHALAWVASSTGNECTQANSRCVRWSAASARRSRWRWQSQCSWRSTAGAAAKGAPCWACCREGRAGRQSGGEGGSRLSGSGTARLAGRCWLAQAGVAWLGGWQKAQQAQRTCGSPAP